MCKRDAVIYSTNLANDLLDKGFKLKKIGINRNKQHRKECIFYFDNTHELREYLANEKRIFI